MKKKLHLSILTMLLAAMSGMTFWSCESESETSPFSRGSTSTVLSRQAG